MYKIKSRVVSSKILCFGLLFCILTADFIFSKTSISEEGKGMGKVVMIIASQGFRDEELLEPKEIFEKNGLEVVIASNSLGMAQGMLGAEVKVDLLIESINVSDYDALIFVGGSGASVYWQDPIAQRLAKDAYSSGKIVAAICIAPTTLANAGILKGKNATVWQSEAGQLKSKGANYTGNPVEKDGNIITAAGPFAAKQFGEQIIKSLKK
jgi:protease I